MMRWLRRLLGRTDTSGWPAPLTPAQEQQFAMVERSRDLFRRAMIETSEENAALRRQAEGLRNNPRPWGSGLEARGRR